MKSHLIYIASLIGVLSSGSAFATEEFGQDLQNSQEIIIMSVKPEEKQLLQKFIDSVSTNEMNDEEIARLKNMLLRVHHELSSTQPMMTKQQSGK